MADEIKNEQHQATPKPQQQKHKRDVPQKPKTLIYAGPNLNGGVLAKYTTFRGELPPHVASLNDKYEDFEQLFVEPAALVAFEQKASQVGTSQHRAYQNALKGGK